MGSGANPQIQKPHPQNSLRPPRSLLVIYCAFPETGTKFGVEVCHVLEYDTEQQVTGNHLLCAWETLEEARESSRKAHTRLSV